jgi:branched-chain amino acid transport system substrate-binding protein
MKTNRWRNPKPVLIVGILIVLSAAVALAAGNGESPQEAEGAVSAEVDTIRIGAAVSLTGNFATAGTLVKAGYDAWVEYVNDQGGITVQGKPYIVEMVYYDDKSEAPTSAKLVEKLITEDEVNLLFGPYSSPITVTTSTIAEKYGYVMITPMANGEYVYTRGMKNLFSVLPPATEALTLVPEVALKQDPSLKTFAAVVMDNAFTLPLGDGVRERSEELGLTEVYYGKYPGNTSDFSPILTAVKDKNPDLIYFGGFFNQCVNFFRQAKQYGVNAKAWGVSAGPSQPDWLEVMGEDGNYVITNLFYHAKLEYEGTTFANTKAFNDFWIEKYGRECDHFTSCGFVTGVLLKLAIEKADSLDQMAIRDALRNNTYNTFLGPFKWDAEGRNIGRQEGLLQVQNVEHVLIWPEVEGGGRIIYPTPSWDER